MTSAPVQSWERLYGSVGLPSADPEEARTIIITTLSVLHQNPVIMTDEYYVRIPLNVYFSAIRIKHFGEIMARLRTTLPEELMQHLCVEVILIERPPLANAMFHPPVVLNAAPDCLNR